MIDTLRIALITSLIMGLDACPPKSESPAVVSTGADTFSITGSLTTPRSAHTATLLASGKVLITGGGGDGSFLASAELYDPSTRRFTATSSMSARRAGHTATVLPNGTVLIVGGLNERDRAELYDPVKGVFTQTNSLITKRVDHTATLLRDGRVLIVGGSKSGTAERPLATAEIYSPSTGKFTVTGNMSIARTAHAAVLLNDGKVLITGGGAGRYPLTTVFRSAELYEPASGTFTRAGDMRTVRYKHGALLLRDGKVLISGGSNQRDWRGRHASAELYDPVKSTFTPTGSMKEARFKHRDALALLNDGRAFIASGGEHPEIYNPATTTFTVIAGSLGEPRFFSTATVLRSGEILIVGGYGEGTPERGPISTTRAWVYRP